MIIAAGIEGLLVCLLNNCLRSILLLVFRFQLEMFVFSPLLIISYDYLKLDLDLNFPFLKIPTYNIVIDRILAALLHHKYVLCFD